MEVIGIVLDITPTQSVTLGAGNAQSTGVVDPLEANIVILRSEPSEDPLVIISMDLLYPGRLLRDILERGLPYVASSNIFLAATHTHRAPMTDDTKTRLGEAMVEYIHATGRRIVQAIWRELEDRLGWMEVALYSGCANAQHSINRRLKKRLVLGRKIRINTYVNAPNPNGPVDETIVVFVFRSDSGKIIAVIWNYACHPVAHPSSSKISSHFPGVVRSSLREEVESASVPVLFMQGFSGNTRPRASNIINGFERRIRRILTGPVFSDLTWQQYGEWTESLASVVVDVTKNALAVDAGPVKVRREVRSSDHYVVGALEPVSFHSVSIGSGMQIVGVSAEVVCEYAPVVRRLAEASAVMCVGCIDHTFGYAPTSKILSEGGYEAGGYCGSFSLEKVSPTIEQDMLLGFWSVLGAEV